MPVAVMAAVLFAGLGSPSGGTHPDERLYLSLANEMQAEGAWLTPTLEHQPDFTKPPLLYWAARACLSLFGPHLWAARLPVALSALLLALTAGRLARRFGGEQAWARAVLLVGTSLGVLRYGRLTMMDVPLALTLALGVEAAWVAAEQRRPRLFLAVGLAAGFSALLKGPVGPLLVLGISAAVVAMRAPELLRTRWTPAAMVVALGVSVPWFAAMVQAHGRPYLERFFLVENLGKFSVAWTLGGEVWLLVSLLVLALPWVGLLQWRTAGLPLQQLTGVWLGGVLLVFSLPGLKQLHYVVPCLVPLLLLAAVPQRPWPVAARATAVLFGMLAAVALLGLRIPFPPPPRLGLLGSAVVLALAAIALWRLRPEAAAVGFAGALVLTLALILPALNPPPVSQLAWEAAGDRPVAIWRQDPGLFELVAGRVVHRINDAEETGAAVAAGMAVVLPASELEGLPRSIRVGLDPRVRWTRLRPRIGFGEVTRALWTADLSPLQEEVLLVVGVRTSERP
jgi:4-amino-4-deoxy-L-arabinose transferase-like glycosyltransferase